MSFIEHPGRVSPITYFAPLFVGSGDDEGLFLFGTNNSPMKGISGLLKYVIAPSCDAVYTTKIGNDTHIFGITSLYTGQNFRVFYNMSTLDPLYLYTTGVQWVISSDFLNKSYGYYYSKKLPTSLGESVTFISSEDAPSITLTLDFPCWTSDTLYGVYKPLGSATTRKIIGTPIINESGEVTGYEQGNNKRQVYIGDVAIWR